MILQVLEVVVALAAEFVMSVVLLVTLLILWGLMTAAPGALWTWAKRASVPWRIQWRCCRTLLKLYASSSLAGLGQRGVNRR